MESIFSNIRSAKVLETYDFVDVIKPKDKVGWQVKSTKASTPVTWKRAKIPDANRLISESHKNQDGLQQLGNAIMAFCNNHAQKSLEDYALEEIGYSRLIVHKNRTLTYFEREICSTSSPQIFEPSDFYWTWSEPKKTQSKEQLPALHGIHRKTQKKWFAWHGLGENQLHFSGERDWWPENGEHCIELSFPKTRLSEDEFMELLRNLSRFQQ